MMLFAPVFLEWPIAMTKALQEKDPAIEIVAMAVTRPVRDRLIEAQKNGEVRFHAIECIEDQIAGWLSAPYDPAHLIAHEKTLGVQTVSDIVIADRQIAQGFITGAPPIRTPFIDATREHDKKRAYICGQLDYISNIYDRYKIDAVFFYAIATSFTVAMAALMEKRGGKNLLLAHSRIDNLMLIDTNEKGFLGPVAQRIARGIPPSQESDKAARKWLGDYRVSLDKEPDYMNLVRSMVRNWYSPKGMMKNFLHAVIYTIRRHEKRTIFAKTGWQKIKESILPPWRYAKFFRAYDFVRGDTLKQRAYIYYALHLDPESSTMQLSPRHTNQLAVIEALAKQKPLHMDLLVKENPYMIGKRPAGFYEKIVAMPGVYLVDPALTSLTLIRHARMTATITGTVAWESMLMHKPVLVIGDSPFLHDKGLDDGAVYKTDLSDMTAAIEQTLACPPVPDENIVRFLAHVFDECFPLDISFIWKKNARKDVDDNPAIVDLLAGKIVDKLTAV